MAITLYGIKNCDTVKKARTWLDTKGVAYTFHDYKTAGIDAGRLKAWAGEVGWENLLNSAGTTFRKLPDAAKANLTEAKAIAANEEWLDLSLSFTPRNFNAGRPSRDLRPSAGTAGRAR